MVVQISNILELSHFQTTTQLAVIHRFMAASASASGVSGAASGPASGAAGAMGSPIAEEEEEEEEEESESESGSGSEEEEEEEEVEEKREVEVVERRDVSPSAAGDKSPNQVWGSLKNEKKYAHATGHNLVDLGGFPPGKSLIHITYYI